MRYAIFALLLGGGLAVALTGALYGQTTAYNPEFNADGMKWKSVPTGHTPGKDNGAGTGLHNSGEDCGICHTTGGKAENYLFTIGGTIYTDRAATTPLKGAEVIIEDYNGNIISMTTNATGNFWTYQPIAANPYAVASHSGTTLLLYSVNMDGTVTPADDGDSRTWQYKAWVKNPDGAIRHMVTIPPVGGSTGSSPRMSCNMHHSPFGSTGAAWASRKSTLASYPSSSVSFKRHILPILRSKCAPCHVPGSTNTRLVTISDVVTASSNTTHIPLLNEGVTSIDYSQGRDFQFYNGSDSKSGWVQDLAVPYHSKPDESPLLLKTKIQPGDEVVHAGGTFWTSEDRDYKAIRQWILEGAQNN